MQDLRQSAQQFMKARQFDQAIAAFDQHLAAEPGDLKSMLQLGVCHLLRGSEDAFRAIYDRAAAMISAAGQIPSAIAKLWQQYQSLLAKVAGTALVLGAMATADAQSAHKYSGGVYVRPTINAVEPATRPTTKPVSSHRYSGGVYVKPIVPTTQPTTQPTSSHKYSGGVYIKPVPKD